jgi:hypothetical protein
MYFWFIINLLLASRSGPSGLRKVSPEKDGIDQMNDYNETVKIRKIIRFNDD